MAKIGIIGSGLGGLSAAGMLAKSGHDVHVFEKLDQAGGRATRYSSEGFTFDMGPSWYMMPKVFDKWFADMGTSREKYYQLKRLDPQYRVFYHDKDVIDIPVSIPKQNKIFEKYEPGSSKKLERYLMQAEYKYNAALKQFLYQNFTNITQLFDLDFITKALLWNALGNWQDHVSHFIKNDKLQRLLLWASIFVGGAPKNLPSLYSLMSYVDLRDGIYYPDDGFHSLVKAMQKVDEDNGVVFHFNEAIQKIDVEKGIAKQLITKSRNHEFDVVIANADYYFTEQILLDLEYRQNIDWSKKQLSPHTFCVYLGVNKGIDKLIHHNYYFADKNTWDKNFDDIFSKNPQWPTETSFYISNPSKTDSHIAPKGSENLFLLVPVAPGLKDTDEQRERISDMVITKLEEITETKIKENIVHKRIISHRDHISLYNAYKGNSLGLTQSLFQSLMFRNKMHSPKVKNLFYTGHYTQPGTGTPICVISGQIVEGEVNKYLSKL